MREVLKISRSVWIRHYRIHFRNLLIKMDFPDPDQIGQRESGCKFPQWLIIFIAVLSVKFMLFTYAEIYRFVLKYWEDIAGTKEMKPISEAQLRRRLWLLGHNPKNPPEFIMQLYIELSKF